MAVRQLGITHQSAASWLAAYHDQVLPQQVEDDTPTEMVEVDELHTFVGKKQESLRSNGCGKGEPSDRGVQSAQGVALDSDAGVCRTSTSSTAPLHR